MAADVDRGDVEDDVVRVVDAARELIAHGERDVDRIVGTLDDDWRGGLVVPSLIPGIYITVLPLIDRLTEDDQ